MKPLTRISRGTHLPIALSNAIETFKTLKKGLQQAPIIQPMNWDKLFLGLFHILAEGQELVDFHQSCCKKPRIWPLNPSH